MENFKSDALKLFSGCDNGIEEAGTAQNRAIWAFGIEFGTFNSQLDGAPKKEGEDEYAISCQKQWPYNQRLFKFLSAMDPAYGLEEWEKFAEDKQPFVLKKSQGFFKGNLFPMGCHNIKSWPQRNIDQTGFHTKEEYVH